MRGGDEETEEHKDKYQKGSGKLHERTSEKWFLDQNAIGIGNDDEFFTEEQNEWNKCRTRKAREESNKEKE